MLQQEAVTAPVRGRVPYGNHSLSLVNIKVENDLDIPKDDSDPNPDDAGILRVYHASYRVGSGCAEVVFGAPELPNYRRSSSIPIMNLIGQQYS